MFISKRSRGKIGFHLFVWFVLLRAAKAEGPLTNGSNPDFQTNLFSINKTFRQNVCNLHQKYDNRTTNLADALNGFNITSIINCPNSYCFMKNGALDAEYEGLYAVLLDEVARRAKFNWRDSFALVDPIANGVEDYSKLLAWNIETYDVAVSWWTKTTARIREGADFPEGWFDSGIIMVGKKVEDESEFQFSTFLEPFTLDLWIMIILTIVFSGLIYYLLEVLDHRSDKRRLGNDPIQNILITGITFTTHFEFHPRTNVAWLLTLSVSFWAMIVGSAYTANLASFLVVQNTPGLQMQSLDDAVLHRYAICVWKGTGVADTLKNDFKNGNFVEKESAEAALKGVLNNDCKVAAVAKGVWKTQKQDGAIGCNLEWIGRKHKEIQSGFVTRHDSGTKCSSLISEVFDIHLRDMLDEGFVDEAFEDYYQRLLGSPTCSTETETNESEDNYRLNLKNMGGIFILHFAICIIAIVITVVAKYTGTTAKRDERIARLENERVKRELLEENNIRRTLAADLDMRQPSLPSSVIVDMNEGVLRRTNSGDMSASSSSTGSKSCRMVDNPSLAAFRETVFGMQSEMQKSQRALSTSIQESQHAQAEVRNQMSSIKEIQEYQHAQSEDIAVIRNQMSSITGMQNSQNEKSEDITEMRDQISIMQKTQHAQTEDITVMRFQMSTLTEMRKAQRLQAEDMTEIREHMARILNLLNKQRRDDS